MCQPFQRLQARDASVVAEIERVEICQSFQRLQAGNAGGVAEIERAEICQPFQRLQARDGESVAQIERAEICQPFKRLQAREFRMGKVKVYNIEPSEMRSFLYQSVIRYLCWQFHQEPAGFRLAKARTERSQSDFSRAFLKG